MPCGPLVTLPLYLTCQLLCPGNLGDRNISAGEDTLKRNSATSLPEGYTVFPELGVAYKFYKNPLQWNAARKLCLKDGASLAIVDSYRKVEIIMGMKDKNQGTWTGLHKLFDDTEWIDVKTGQPAGFIPWRPNAFADSGLCIANRHDTLGVSPWNCNEYVPVVCEIPIPKSSTNRLLIK